MFYRRKIILGLLEVFENELEKLRLQKLLFILSRNQKKSEYDFVPYKCGCHSFSLSADITTMLRKEYLLDSNSKIIKIDKTNYFTTLKVIDQNRLLELKSLYGTMSIDSLVRHTYINYPFWAINSLTASEILDDKYYTRVLEAKPNLNDSIILFTIGYEGISLEEYLVRLLKNDVKVLVDVRRNPLSMKYGFSKTLLQKYCNEVGIEYIHYPEVGIQTEERQELNNQKDYDKLFSNYKKCNLPNTIETQDRIFSLLIEKKRIALTCFEANICQCHRKHLAEAISEKPEFLFELKHI